MDAQEALWLIDRFGRHWLKYVTYSFSTRRRWRSLKIEV